MRILFFIGTLSTGGAERQMAQLAIGLAQWGHDVSLVTIYPGGQNWDWLKRDGIVKLEALFDQRPQQSIKVGWQLSFAPILLRKILQRESVSIIYSALYGSNWIAWQATRRLPGIKLVWGIRASNLKLNWKRAMPFQLCKRVSHSVSLLIANSHTGLEFHKKKGYKGRKYVVIPNGIDTNYFHADPEARARLRAEWGINEHKKLIGLVGRLDPMKDHPTFLRAAAQLAQEQKDVYFVCVGDGATGYRQQLQALSQDLGLTERLIWAGAREDMPAVYNALDIAAASSYGEGFPNVIGEAMACGVSCVVTDVGDSAWIVGDTGVVVPPSNAVALATGLQKLLNDEAYHAPALVTRTRQRIEANFSIDRLIETTATELTALLKD